MPALSLPPRGQRSCACGFLISAFIYSLKHSIQFRFIQVYTTSLITGIYHFWEGIVGNGDIMILRIINLLLMYCVFSCGLEVVSDHVHGLQ